MKVVFACARTGGHINPAIALAKHIVKNDKNSEILFIGTKDGLENNLVKNAGFSIKHVRTGKLRRSLSPKNISEMYNAFLGISDAKKILKEFKPDFVFGTGGYICFPVIQAAKSLKIPYFLHESNAFPGISVKLLAKIATKVFVGFEDAKKRLKNKENIVVSGTPIKFSKSDYEKLDRNSCMSEFNVDVNKKVIVVTGGSQGALKFSNTILEYLKKYRDENRVFVVITGDKNYESVLEEKKKVEKELNISLDKYIIIERFVYDMEKLYKAADICITRSGAMTITELMVLEKPAILVPYPYATENHQLYNAEVLKKEGTAEIIEEKDLNIDILKENIDKIINNYSNYRSNNNNKENNVENIIYNNITKSINK